MKGKLVWAVAAAMVGMFFIDVSRLMRARRRRSETKHELVRWEGEGGNVLGN